MRTRVASRNTAELALLRHEVAEFTVAKYMVRLRKDTPSQTWKTILANHMGETEVNWKHELQQLGDRLFDEAAPLVCHADLHLAVQYTNRFAFDAASKALQRWEKVFN